MICTFPLNLVGTRAEKRFKAYPHQFSKSQRIVIFSEDTQKIAIAC